MDWANKIILVTGGTGSFGQKFTEIMLKKYKPKIIRIFSRDELKQWEMQQKFNDDEHLRFFIGDVRDVNRLYLALEGVDIVIHTAALKQVPSCEYNPFEAVKTNILGAQNIIEAAIERNVEKIMAISTDKAVSPVNLYGATKMCMERLFTSANFYVGGKKKTRMACCRYGNVLGSRGSVIPLFNRQKDTGIITITDERMTRFWITLEQGVEFVIRSIETMQGGEVFVPKLPSMRITDLAEAVAPGCRIKFTGIRPGEKINECLLTVDEARHSLELDDSFIVYPELPWWSIKRQPAGRALVEDFSYTSDKNKSFLTKEDLKVMLKEL